MGLIVKDTMVLIHLAKVSLLEKSGALFGKVIIPPAVFEEAVVAGKEKKFEDALVIEQLVKDKKIVVKRVRQEELITKANQFNIFGGEAQAVALYWEKKAAWLATDDDNVRSKKEILDLNIVGTPAIILRLYQEKKIESLKAHQAIARLRKIGWFNSEVLDTMLSEVKKNA